jgi:isoleucyl-tRNA synthetase
VPETDYKATLQLPKTDFPMKANLPKREPETLKKWDELDIYARLLETRKDAPTWILHDGPPYANGRVHLGTALNKILKDFVVRSRSMLGNRTPFVPGWDCHGMPIEHKVSRSLGPKARTMPKLELRKLCRAEAEKWIDLQRQDFRRLGCIGDWFNPYLTMAPEYDGAEIGVLRKLVEFGYVYRGLRPVHWCFECRTALAEAEVEYAEHKSPSIYVAFRLNANLLDAAALASENSDGAELAAAHRSGKLFAVIWTTTPWTLPANLGISLNENFEYVALKCGDNYYIVAQKLADAVEKTIGLKVDKRIELSREAIHALDGKDIFRHPFLERDVKLIYAPHVTAESGTGLVHTAPSHGHEDFLVGTQYGLSPNPPVDGSGVFTSGEWTGKNVFDANPLIVEHLRTIGALLHTETYTHSYPHCWRSHTPLIFLATEQWFINIDHQKLREKIVSEIDAVTWVPPWARDRIRNMTETRPDWTISRQRAWGVPIPALRCEKCAHVMLDFATMKKTEEIFSREGSDAWFIRPATDFIAPGLKCEKCGNGSFTKEEDVLDVWFDSGSSQAAVLGRRPELRWPADAYVEGVDQARGWFASSLVCAVATRESAPFKSVISHGLTLDDKNRKMSKSAGNAEDAADAVNRLGADVIRLVYASLDYSSDMNLGKTVYDAVSESYRKIRNTCRFVLGNISDFDPARDSVAYGDMLEFDRFMLARTEKLKAEARRAFENFDFQAAYHAVQNFAVVDLSSLYIDVARDRLYCGGANSRERRSAQTALYHVLDAMVRILAPLIPYTAEEVYAHLPGAKAESVHLLTFAEPHREWADEKLLARWERLMEVRAEALKLLEWMRQSGAIGAPLEADVRIHWNSNGSAATNGNAPFGNGDAELLKELFVVSNLQVLSDAAAQPYYAAAQGKNDSADFMLEEKFARVGQRAPVLLTGARAGGRKCPRCWMYFDDDSDSELDPRCRAVVDALR